MDLSLLTTAFTSAWTVARESYFFKMVGCLLILQAYRNFLFNRALPKVAGKTVFISGGSSGIGEQLCKDCVKAGAAKVIIAARRLDELERVKRESERPERVMVFQLDLSDPKQVSIACSKLFEQEHVDVLINNGGLSQRDCFVDLDFAACQHMMNVNCLAHIAVTKAVLPSMIKRKGGQIVNVLSVSGMVGLPCRTMYSASKFALSGFGKALRPEVKEHGISVCQVYPGYVQTNISKNAMTGSGTPFGKTDSNIKSGMPVEKAAMQILKAMALGRTEFILGGLIYQLAPFLALSEAFMERYQAGKLKSQLSVK